MKRMVWVVAIVLVVALSGTATAADGASIYASSVKCATAMVVMVIPCWDLK